MYRHWHRQRPQKPSPWIALGVIFFSLYLSNYINSLQGKPLQLNSVSNISDTERHFRGEEFWGFLHKPSKRGIKEFTDEWYFTFQRAHNR